MTSAKPTTIIDLSHKLDFDTQVYPGDVAFSCRASTTIAIDGYNTRSMTMGSHSGTHIDAPFHFYSDGKTIDQIPLSDLVGPALIADLSAQNLHPRERLGWEYLESYADQMREGVILLINTGWSKKYWQTPEYLNHPYLTRDAAEGAWSRGIRVIGVDTLNPDETPVDSAGGADGWSVHETFLGRGGIVAENMTNIEALVGKDNIVINLIPLRLSGSDGSPIRAFATVTDRAPT